MNKTVLLAMPLLLAIPACGGDKPAGPPVAVKATDTTCEPATTNFSPGTYRFEVTNAGTKPTELYVYGPNDKIVAEVEGVGPGTKRTLTAKLAAGSYELACKPGETGSGIRAPITVS